MMTRVFSELSAPFTSLSSAPCCSVLLLFHSVFSHFLMRDRFERVHNSYASSFSRITNALSIDLSQQTQRIALTHKDNTHTHRYTQIRIKKQTFSNLIFCLSVIHCFLTATEKCILLIFILFALLHVYVQVRAHIFERSTSH